MPKFFTLRGDFSWTCAWNIKQHSESNTTPDPYPWTSCRPKTVRSYQTTVDRLSRSFLHLPQLGDEVPEARLGHHMVGGKNPHAVQWRCRIFSRGQKTPNNLIFPKLQRKKQKHSTQTTQHVRLHSSLIQHLHTNPKELWFQLSFTIILSVVNWCFPLLQWDT